MSDEAARVVALTGADQTVQSGASYYKGISVRETAGAVSVIQVWDNTAASGALITTISLAANGSFTEWLAGGGIMAETGLFVKKVSGTFEGGIRVG